MKKEYKAENIRFLDSVNYIDDKFISEVLADVKLPKDADDGRLRRALKQIAVLAACVVLLGAIFPAVSWLIGRSTVEPGGNPGSLPTAEASRVVRNGSQIWGDEAFIKYNSNLDHYVPESGTYERLYGYDRDDASVPYRGFEVLSQIIDGKLYFIYDYRARVEDDENLKAAYLDLSTMEITDICDMSYDHISGGAYVCGDYYYYSRRIDIPARAGKLYRISLKDGREELVLEFAQEESLFMAADGVIVTMNRFGKYMDSETPKNCVINAYDIETLEKRVLWSDDGSKYRTVSSSAYLDGDLYFLAMHADYSKYDIIRVNIESGKAECILEGISDHWWLTDEGIWYYPCEPRTVNYHSPFSSFKNSLFGTKASPTLHFCDLDGENDREIYTNADIAFDNPRSAVIVDGKLCGYFCGSFPSLGLDSALILAEIDLETGEITALDDPWFVTSSETTPAETTSPETEPPKTEEEFVAPIPEGGLDFIEHVGEVPEEFKEIVENDTFGGLREIEGRLYYPDKRDGCHYIVFVDKQGRETAVKTTEAKNFINLFVDSEGNYLAVYSTGMKYSSILVKFDSSGKIIFNTYCKDPVGASLDEMIEVDGGYIFVGQIGVKSTLVNLTVTDIVITKISSLGKIENTLQFGGNDHDTVKHVEKTAEGVSVYFYLTNREDRVTSSLQRFDFDHNAVLKAQTEIKESNIPSVNDPSFTVDGKPYYKIADFFKDYDWDSSFTCNVIEYDDFMLLVYNRFTSDYRHSTHGFLSTLGPNFFYRERVYAAYTKDGELIWRTAFDTTDYETLKEFFG